MSMLEEINRALVSPEAAGSACIFPMCTKSERVVRLAVNDAILMNSREKVPFYDPPRSNCGRGFGEQQH